MTDTTDNKSNMMTVKTGYARTALMIMAANLCLTGYAIISLANLQFPSTEEENTGQTTTTVTTPQENNS